MPKPARRMLWPARLLTGLLALVLGLTALVYGLTDHPRPVQAAELRCPESTPPLKADQTVKIMSWNVQYLAGRGYVFFYDTFAGDGPDTRPSAQAITRTLKEVTSAIQQENPDIVMLQEVDRDSKRTDFQDQLALIQAGLGGVYGCSATTYYHRASFVPHPKIMGKVGLSLSILSKNKIDSATRYQLPRICGDPLTVAFNFKRAVLGISLPVAGGKPLTILNTHMDAFAQGCDTMQKQVQYVQDLLAKTPAPWVFGGDLNLLATPAAYGRLPAAEQRYFNPTTELRPLLEEYASFPTPAQVDSGDAHYFTYFANDPTVGKADRTIDFLFFSPGLAHQQGRVRQDNPKISDHYALLTTLNVPGE